MVKKSFLHNMMAFMSGKRSQSKKISAENATEMQLKYQDSFVGTKSVKEYPPYQDIAKQLASDRTEIFRAAVFYLCRIAENESKYGEDILNILRKYATESSRGKDDEAYLKAQITKLEQINHCLPE